MPTTTADRSTRITRTRWHITGQVQGVGFRPFVYREATALSLVGWVRNDGDAVVIEAQGCASALARFHDALLTRTPALARIDSINKQIIDALAGSGAFTIDASQSADAPTGAVTIDTAVCPDCLAEMRSATDRRYGYGLINCTNCGPRYSIVRGVPYDRPNTTMAGFTMCDDCAAEYTDPSDRRFHAQPTACCACGPTVELADPAGKPVPGDPIDGAAALLRRGEVLLIKGLGGFHLSCRADDERAVVRMRQLKHRDAKPFAVMVRSIDAARGYVELSDEAAGLMTSPRCPIVVAPRTNEHGIADAVAPNQHRLGLMLPYTPLQHRLFDALGDLPLVMTSANVSDEPLVIDNADALVRLSGMFDAVLWHDRPIERAVDDSVLLDAGRGEAPLPIRRARGYVPEPIALPLACDEPGLCVGGELKNTVAVVRDGRAIVSHHLGDLKHPLAFEAFKRAADDLCELFDVEPRWIAHDQHPGYLSTAYARDLAARFDARLVPVQHHHAHAAALLAEHRMPDPIVALTCDGVGYGSDGEIWGGEVLITRPESSRRVARLRPLALPGGDAAARDTRRCALAMLVNAYGDEADQLPIARRLLPDDDERRMLASMVRRGVSAPLSSALGRYFDGAAALLGLCEQNTYEAQSAMRLEAEAAPHKLVVGTMGSPGFGLTQRTLPEGEVTEIDPAELTRRLVEGMACGVPAGQLAAWFHDTIAAALAGVARRAAESHGVDTVGLTGGCFINQRLTRAVVTRLTAAGLRVIRHQLVSPGDGGLALGQALAASALLHGCKGEPPCV